MYNPNQTYDPNAQAWQQQQQQATMDAGNAGMAGVNVEDPEDGDNSHRPPNAFILYSQAMRSEARQQNPSLSNTEVSRILGKMWKEVPNEVKLQYKQKAAKLQEEFKKAHPDYTYRKARRKRALNELLTKSAQGYPSLPNYGTPDQMAMLQMMQNNQMLQNNQMYPMMAQAAGQVPANYAAYGGMPGAPGAATQMQGQPGVPGISMGTMDPSQQQMYTAQMPYNQGPQ